LESFFWLSHFLADEVNGWAVVAVEFSAEGVGKEFFSEAACERFFLSSEELAKVGGVVEGFTVVEFSGSIDGEFIGVSVAPSADGVIVFKRETGGVEFVMALGATGVGAMFDKLLAESDSTADIGFNFGDFVRWGRWCVVKKLVHDVDSTDYR